MNAEIRDASLPEFRHKVDRLLWDKFSSRNCVRFFDGNPYHDEIYQTKIMECHYQKAYHNRTQHESWDSVATRMFRAILLVAAAQDFFSGGVRR